jgi:hypothetical protein
MSGPEQDYRTPPQIAVVFASAIVPIGHGFMYRHLSEAEAFGLKPRWLSLDYHAKAVGSKVGEVAIWLADLFELGLLLVDVDDEGRIKRIRTTLPEDCWPPPEAEMRDPRETSWRFCALRLDEHLRQTQAPEFLARLAATREAEQKAEEDRYR